MKVPAIFNNKILCYAMLFLAVMNIIGYVSTGAYECLVVFSVAYVAANYYCKNQTCAILGGLFASNFLWGCGRVRESFIEAMGDSSTHLNKAADSATKGALEAMKEFNKENDEDKKEEKAKVVEKAENAADKAVDAAVTAESCKALGKGFKDGKCE